MPGKKPAKGRAEKTNKRPGKPECDPHKKEFREADGRALDPHRKDDVKPA